MQHPQRQRLTPCRSNARSIPFPSAPCCPSCLSASFSTTSRPRRPPPSPYCGSVRQVAFRQGLYAHRAAFRHRRFIQGQSAGCRGYFQPRSALDLRGVELDDSSTLRQCNVQKESTIHVILKRAPSPPPPPPPRVPVLEVGRFARLERDDGGDRTLLRCKVTLSRSSDAWTTPRFSILTDTDVLVLRMNAPNEQGFAYVRMPNGQEGFVQLKYLVPHYPVQ